MLALFFCFSLSGGNGLVELNPKENSWSVVNVVLWIIWSLGFLAIVLNLDDVVAVFAIFAWLLAPLMLAAWLGVGVA